MVQTSRLVRLGALLVGIHLAVANSAWAGPTGGNRVVIAPKPQGAKGNGNSNVQKTSNGAPTTKGTTSTGEGGGTNTPCNNAPSGGGTGAQGGGNSNQSGSGSGSQNGGGSGNQNGGSGTGSGNQNGGVQMQLDGKLLILRKKEKKDAACTPSGEPQTLVDEVKRILNKGK